MIKIINKLNKQNMSNNTENKQLTKDSIWAYNVNGVNLQMKIYWQESTEHEEEGFYMEALPQKIKYNGHECYRVFQLEATKKNNNNGNK